MEVSGSVDIGGGSIDVTGVDVSGIGAFSELTDSLENLALLAICIAGFAFGWKKILPGLIFYVSFWMVKDGKFENTNQLALLIFILLWVGIKWLLTKIWTFFKSRSKRLNAAAESE